MDKPNDYTWYQALTYHQCNACKNHRNCVAEEKRWEFGAFHPLSYQKYPFKYALFVADCELYKPKKGKNNETN